VSDITDSRIDTDHLWKEHGWGLRGWQVAALVGGIIVVSLVIQWLG